MKTVTRFFKRYNLIIIVILIVVQGYYYNLDELLFIRPQSLHIMRQTDCLSMTQNYYEKNISLWEPEIQNHFLDDGLSGKSAAEFPLIYYLVGQLWKIFGKSEGLFRIINLSILVLGLLTLFEVTKKYTGNVFLAGFLSLLLFTSPMLVFYSMNFMPNGPAFGLVLLAWYFIFRYSKSDSLYILWIATILFSLAILIKIAAAISFIALAGWLFYENIFIKKENRRISLKMVYIIQIAIVVISSFAWYIYVDHYNEIYGGSFSYHGIWPVWEMDRALFEKVIDHVKVIFFKDYFLNIIQYITVVMWIILLFSFKKMNSFQRFFLIILPVGMAMYLALWFQVLEAHDYYLINMLIVLVYVWVMFFYHFKDKKVMAHPVLYLILVGLLIYSSQHCKTQLDERHRGWMNDWYMTKLEALTELEPIFIQHGIKKEDKVISIPDGSVCATLYYMERNGYTDFASDFSKDEIFRKRINQGAKYLIINDPEILNREVLQPYIKDEMVVYKNVHIYDLRNIDLK